MSNQYMVSEAIRRWEDWGQFVIPTFLKAIAFVVTEVGELFDAWLRTFADDGFVRNNGPKDVDPVDELADVVLMCYVAADRLGVDLDAVLARKVGRMDAKKRAKWQANSIPQ